MLKRPSRLRSLAAAISAGWPQSPEVLRRTERNPGADLSRLPWGLDLRGISIVDGIRAALACALVIAIEELVHWPPLLYMAFAANLTCFSDAGGPLRPRLAGLLAFTVLGALIWAAFGLLRATELPVVIVPVAAAAIFCTSFARVWGQPALVLGNVLTVTLVFALDRPLDLTEAALIAAMFVAGGAWATLLALLLWRLDPYNPGRRSLAEVWRQLSALAVDLSELGRRARVTAAEWDAHALAHRRAVRSAIEQARITLADLARLRGASSTRIQMLLLRLETGDQLFGAFVALSDLMDDDGAPAARAAGQRLARRLAPLLGVLARSMLSDRPPRKRSVERVLAQALVDSASDPAVHAITKTIVDRLSVALRLFSPDKSSFGDPSVRQRTSGSWHERMIDPLRANLTWNSAVLRHALRAAVVAIPALVITLLWQGAFTHWLTITVVLTLQPYYGATWQRALERIAGTVLGGLAGALLVHAASSPVALAALMFPLCILGFSARRVSYGAFIGCLMPQLVVLVEFIRPGYSSWDIVEMRVLFTLIGGAIAVAGCLMLWPSWERNRIRREVNAALGDLGLYADAVFGTILNEAMPRTINEYRRQAGLALNNLEASIARALQEPGQNRRTRLKLEQVMIADATLRRLGGRLSVLQHDPNSRRALATDIGRQWRTWIKDAISAVRRGKPIAPKPSDDVELESLSRIARQIELLAGALDPVAHDGRHQPGQRQAQER